MGNDADGGEVELMDQLRQIVNKCGHFVIAIGRPRAVAMAPQIRGNDMPVMTQFFGYPIPATRVIAAAMDQEQRRRVGITPVDIV